MDHIPHLYLGSRRYRAMARRGWTCRVQALTARTGIHSEHTAHLPGRPRPQRAHWFYRYLPLAAQVPPGGSHGVNSAGTDPRYSLRVRREHRMNRRGLTSRAEFVRQEKAGRPAADNLAELRPSSAGAILKERLPLFGRRPHQRHHGPSRTAEDGRAARAAATTSDGRSAATRE